MDETSNLTEVKDLIVTQLKANRGRRFSVLELYRILKEKYNIQTTYQSLLKYVEIMAVYGDLRCEDYQSVKLIWIEEETK